MSDAPPEIGFYSRMLPARELPVEAIGGLLSSLGAALGILSLLWWPVLLGTPGVALGASSLAMSRSHETQRRFAICFCIAAGCWLIGLAVATYRSQDLGI